MRGGEGGEIYSLVNDIGSIAEARQITQEANGQSNLETWFSVIDRNFLCTFREMKVAIDSSSRQRAMHIEKERGLGNIQFDERDEAACKRKKNVARASIRDDETIFDGSCTFLI